MNSDEAIARLDALNVEYDSEAGHGEADNILLASVPADIREAYIRVMDRAAWWACA